MNNRITSLLALGCLFLAAPSCSKKGSPAPACKLVTVTDASNGTSNVYNITYNNDGNISTILGAGNNPYSSVFTYADKLIMINKSQSASQTETDSILLNDNGLMAFFQAKSTGTTVVTTFTYTADGQLLKSVTQVNGGTPSTTTYQYTNGDLTSSSNGNITGTYLYYTDKPFADGDYLEIEQLITYGALYMKNAHLIKGYQGSGNVENINYTFDNTGKITGVSSTNGSNIENVAYQYSCH